MRQRLTLVSGTFDPLHAGHLAYLAKARELTGGPLLVNVSRDHYIFHVKGRLAVVPEVERLALLQRVLSRAYLLHLQHPEGDAEDILAFRPDHYVKGMDWTDRLPAPILAACDAVGTRIHYVESGSDVHASDFFTTHI